MNWRTNVLVVANVTATSDELVTALKDRTARESVHFMLVVPADPLAGGRTAAAARLEEALERYRSLELDADGIVGASDVIIAVSDEWDPRRYDEIVVSTLPIGLSKWLHAGLPERIEHLTGAHITHVVSQAPKPPVEVSPAPPQHQREPMGPLAVLSWGAHKQQR
jgi:hypothetical protein